jgi:mono/diheme cytochrome c family protein
MRRLAAAAVVVLGALAACGVFDSDAERGHAVADRWCAECHRIAADQPSGSRAGHILPPPVEAPSFMAIAARPGVDAAYLRHFMMDLHLPMPTYRLSAAEQDSVIRYILSLKTSRS